MESRKYSPQKERSPIGVLKPSESKLYHEADFISPRGLAETPKPDVALSKGSSHINSPPVLH